MEQGLALAGFQSKNVASIQILDHDQGDLALPLLAPSRQNRKAKLESVLRNGVQKGRLPHSCVALDQTEGSLPTLRLGEARPQEREWLVALKQTS